MVNKLIKQTILLTVLMMLSSVMVAAQDIGAQAHQADVTLTPDVAICGDLPDDFNLNIYNQAGSDSIFEVRVYNTPGLEDFTCGPAPEGWSLFDFVEFDNYCEYKSVRLNDSAVINATKSLDFTFSAIITPTEECTNSFTISTLDRQDFPNGEHQFHNPQLLIDCAPPVVIKEVGEPKLSCDPNVQSCDWYVNTQTTFGVTVYDDNTTQELGDDPLRCDLGLDECEYNIYYKELIGDEWQLIESYDVPIEDIGKVDWEFQYNEDSYHKLEVICTDIAGNEVVYYEEDIVDDQAPEITKTIEGPHQGQCPPAPESNDVCYLDGVTTIKVDVVDPQPHPVNNVSCWWDYEVEGNEKQGEGEQDITEFPFYINFPEESYHTLTIYCEDGLGNSVRDIEQFIVDKTPPEITKTVGEPQADSNIVLSTTGDADSEYSSEEAFSAVQSIYLYADEISESTNEGRIEIPLEGMTLGDINTIMWQAYVVTGYMPHVDIILDFDNDGNADDALVVEYDKAGAPSDQALGSMTYQYNTWVNTFDDKGSIDDSTGAWLSSGAAGPIGGGGFIYGTLADWKAGTVDGDVDADTKVLRLEIEVDGWIAESESYVDLVKINGEAIVDELDLFITSQTPITLECYDQEPHPVGMETIYYQYKVDVDGDGFNNDNWVGPFSEQTNELNFTFPEASAHLLEYWCVDGVNKSSEHYFELDKVDNEAPELVKEMFGHYLGQCPPRPDSDDECYVADNGESGVHVYVKDPNVRHASDNVMCEYQIWWETDENTCEEANGISYVDGHCLIDAGDFSDYQQIIFSEDSTHYLEILCEDKVGNQLYDVERFRVDSTPPITTKYYDEPFFNCEDWAEYVCAEEPQIVVDDLGAQVVDDQEFCVEEMVDEYCGGWDQFGHVYPQWITSGTNITLEAIDNKVGVNYTKYRVTLVDDENCYDASACSPLEENDGPWSTYEGEFSVPESSCHLIEYWSNDLLENQEELNWQCVFVDNEAPETHKEVGEPKVIRGELCLPDEIQVQSVGDVVHQLDVDDLPVPGYPSNCAVGLTFDGTNLYYNICNDANIYEIDPITGALQSTFDTTGKIGSTQPNAMAYDSKRNGIWFGTQDSADGVCDADAEMPIYFWDFSDDSVTEMFTVSGLLVNPANSENFLRFCFLDGLAYNENDPNTDADDEIWFSDDIDHNIGVFRPDGTLVQGLDGRDIDSSINGALSGLAIGGSNLYIGNNGGGDVFRADIDTWTLVDQFVSDEHRQEDMACDPHTFAPKEVMWVRTTPQGVMADDVITAFEIEPGTCGVGGEDPEEPICEPELYITQDTPIYLSCNDVDPHPVGHESMNWRYRISDDCINWGEWSEWEQNDGSETVVQFDEDSCHQLEYYCVDVLGNEEEHMFEIDIVDTQPPTIDIEVEGPQVGVCPGEECIIDGVTLIHVDANDPEPHPVNNVYCSWDYEVEGNDKQGQGEQNVTPPFVVNFPEESHHTLSVSCWDELGNLNETSYLFTVDKTVPEIEKNYSEPYFAIDEEEFVEWVTSNTGVNISAYDPEPHPSGLDRIEYRISLVDDENCWSQSVCQEDAEGSGDWSVEFGEAISFSIPEESCHLIEARAVDNVNKTAVHKQCVFVDNTPPTPSKEVGVPHALIESEEDYSWKFYPEVNGNCWTGEDGSIDCWSVTLLTPISMTCLDEGDHPVGNGRVFFKVDVDAEDLTPEYCEDIEGAELTEDGWCNAGQELPEFRFKEISEHNLKFYCEDALGNRGPIDDEKFKVEETTFSLWLNHKWNLVSVPVNLLDDSLDKVFQGHEDSIISVWYYDAIAGEWLVYTPNGDDGDDDFDTMEVGKGYWILVNNQSGLNITIGGSLLKPVAVPPTLPIKGQAWNLIGYYGSDGIEEYHGPVGAGKPAACALNSFGDSIFDKGFVSLWTYWEPDNPDVWKPLGKYDRMDPGAGYWVYATEDANYVPTTTCDGIIVGP